MNVALSSPIPEPTGCFGILERCYKVVPSRRHGKDNIKLGASNGSVKNPWDFFHILGFLFVYQRATKRSCFHFRIGF